MIKKLLFCLIIGSFGLETTFSQDFISVVSVNNGTLALGPATNQIPIEEARQPIIDNFKERIDNIANQDYYKDVTFEINKTEDGKNKLVLKYKALPALERAILLFVWAEELGNALFKLEAEWLHEAKQTPPEPPSLPGEPAKTSIEKISSLRKLHALKFEKLIDDTFKQYKTEIPEADRKDYRERIQKWHDSQHLIDRKK